MNQIRPFDYYDYFGSASLNAGTERPLSLDKKGLAPIPERVAA